MEERLGFVEGFDFEASFFRVALPKATIITINRNVTLVVEGKIKTVMFLKKFSSCKKRFAPTSVSTLQFSNFFHV